MTPSGARRPRRLTSAVAGVSVTVLHVVRSYPLSTVVVPLLLLLALLGLGLFGVLSASNAQANGNKAKVVSIAESSAFIIETKFAAAVAPMRLLQAAVQYRPAHDAAVLLVNGLAPDLVAETPPGSVLSLALLPAGVMVMSYPNNSMAPGVNIFEGLNVNGSSSVVTLPPPLVAEEALTAIRENRLVMTGPFLTATGRMVGVLQPIFVRVANENATFNGAHASPSSSTLMGLCGDACGYNSTTKMRWWGLASISISVEALLSGRDSPRAALEHMGFNYRLASDMAAARVVTTEPERRMLRVVTQSAAPPREPVDVGINLLGHTWTLSVSTGGPWTPAWTAWAIAAVVVASVTISALLACVVIAWRKHQMLLEALLPKEVIREMEADRQLRLKPPVFIAETPAQILLGLLDGLLDGGEPDVKDIVFLRSALIRSIDFYTPLNLKSHIRESDLDADVIHSLLRQLASTGSGPDATCRRTSDGGLAVDELLFTAHINPSSILASHPDGFEGGGDDVGSPGVGRSTRLSRLAPLQDVGSPAVAGGDTAAADSRLLSHSPPAVTLPQQLCFDTIADALNIVLAPGLLGMASLHPSGAGGAGGTGGPGSSLGLCNSSGPRPCEPAPASLSFLSSLPCDHNTAAADAGGAGAGGAGAGGAAAGGADVCALRWDRGGTAQPYGAGLDSAWQPSGSSIRDVCAAPSGLRSSSSCGGAAAAAGTVTVTASGSERHEHLSGNAAGGHAAGFGAYADRHSSSVPAAMTRISCAGYPGGVASTTGSSLPVSAYTTPTPDLQLHMQGLQQHALAAAAALSATTAAAAPSAPADEGPASLPSATVAAGQQALQTRPGSMRRQGGGRNSAGNLSLAGILAALRSHARSSSCDGVAPPSGGAAAPNTAAGSAAAAVAISTGMQPLPLLQLNKSLGQQLQDTRTLSPPVLLHLHQQLAAGGSVGSRAPPQTPMQAPVDSPFHHTFDLTSLPAATMAFLNNQPQPLPPPPPPPALPPPPIIADVERVLARADEWCFDTWALDEVTQGHALSALGFYLLQRSGLLDKLGLNPLVVARLLRTIEAGYQPNPYHSATHAADVLQTLHVIIHGAGLHVHYLDRIQLLAVYFAAIVHDLGHPGLNNDFLIATGDALAVRYNDRAPLENHHAASLFELVARPELNALAVLTTAERAAFRKLVIELVLATDMKQHFAIISHFNTVHSLTAHTPGVGQQAAAATPPPAAGLLQRQRCSDIMAGPQSPRGPRAQRMASLEFEAAIASAAQATAPEHAPRPLDEPERLVTLQVCLKAADIGHLGENSDVHERWLSGLEEEFFRQGDKEKAMGLPISPLFDRTKKGVSKSQVGFYDFVALPLVHALASAFPGAKPIEAAFNRNYMHWKAIEAKQSTPTN
ncbi:hypothetical protein HYH02_002482 [Chlamydomonas schloesseri]|uniref:Phosphodiesterase n=1 Tax=Chlamydomonas schloesseri TaxID=2026947 RepID=A0A836BB11_9CHLO|nr:hypothetical protein HYH02_002482 [Chlamydomonas schloesseri]|eukprot:KAG2453156.1 hypothetical protein HYH02_002482 [Chlamydomonas schloesseri]